ncbi:MAG: ExeM/NucH family extracellular endonuclease, partial [Anaerolineales bacterium]|nr:ExeM/NucH family extracellular endonuclease [Anaerolineales bacterium]
SEPMGIDNITINGEIGGGPTTPNIIINELDSDTPGADTAEFIELYGDANASLNGFVVVFFNGSNDASYRTIDLDGFSTDANGYFVIGNPGVTNVDVTFPAGLSTSLQNGADAVALYQGDAADFPDNTAVTTTNLIDAIVYDTADPDDAGLLALLNAGQPQVNESGNGDKDNHSSQRCPNGTGGARNTNTYDQFAPTPGTENVCNVSSGIINTFIHEVQGSGPAVAINSTVRVTATVIADYQASDQLSGFFIQEEDGDVDANADTSEGIFVYCGGCAVDVAVGDQVEVVGLAEDFFDMSQIDVTETDGEVSVLSNGNPLPTAASISLPASGSTEAAATFENVEGMLVTFTDELFVSEYFELARYGQLVLTAGGRPAQFTDANEPSVAGYNAFLDDLNSKRIILDDDNNIQNDAIGTTDEPYFWPQPGLSTTNYIRGGDSISGLTGVLHWSFAGQSGTDAWRVRPVDGTFNYDFTANNTRTTAPDPVGGSLKVASFNVLNYFTTLDSRGADSTAELDRQRAKTAAAICAMDADIVGLIEIENNGSVALEDLLNGTDGINANCGPYDYVNTGVIGTDEIVVAYIYKTATVSTVGSHAILDSSVDARFVDTRNRPALAQTFEETATGGVLTVVVNHLKSKGSGCGAGDDAVDGSGNCNATRADAAAAMVDWLATDPTGSGDPDFLIIGDLNSYRNEEPIDNIEAGSDDTASTADDYVDLLDALIGSSAYTYVFDGQLGYLDHALANNSLFPQVTGVTPWHINADEIPVFDYNDEILDAGESSFERESGALPIYEA